MRDPGVTEQDLRGLIYGALLGENDWASFLEWYAKLVPDCKATLFYHDARLQAGAYTISAGLPNQTKDSYSAHYAPRNPWMRGATTRPVGLVVSDQYMLSREGLLQTEFYNDWLHPQGIEGCIGVTLHREGSHNSFLAITTTHPNAHEEVHVMRTLERIVPDLQRAFGHYRKHGSPTPSAGEVTHPNLGVITIGADRRVKSMNAMASSMFGLTDLLTQDAAGRFCSSSHDFLHWIDHCLKLWGRPQEAPPVRSFLLGRPPELPTRVTVISISIDQGERFFRGPECHLLVEPPPRRKVSISEITAFYGLTGAEARVCAGLAAGATLTEIAQSHQVGLETVRTHLKAIFMKTGVSRQADLTWLLAQFPDRSLG